MNTAPTPATAVRHRLLVVFGANRLSPTISLSLIAHHTDDRSSTIKLFSKKNQVHLFFLASLCWHRREAQFFLQLSSPWRAPTNFVLPLGPGSSRQRGDRAYFSPNFSPEVASRPLSRLRVWGPQPLLRARHLDGGTGSRALSARRPLQRMLDDWGLWLLGGAMLSAGKRWLVLWLVHASQPHLPIPFLV